MTCRELIEFLWRYVEGELGDRERATFDAHLAACPDCVSYLASYRATMRLVRESFVDSCGDLPNDVPEELVRAILDARSK